MATVHSNKRKIRRLKNKVQRLEERIEELEPDETNNNK